MSPKNGIGYVRMFGIWSLAHSEQHFRGVNVVHHESMAASPLRLARNSC